MTEAAFPLPASVPPVACDNCGVKDGAVFCCNKCMGLFCIDCVTFSPPLNAKIVSERVHCWRCDGVGGAAGHQKHLKGVSNVQEH